MQGSNADIIKVAMLRIHERLRAEGRGARLVLQVHDELLLEVPDAETSAVRDARARGDVRRVSARSTARRGHRRRATTGPKPSPNQAGPKKAVGCPRSEGQQGRQLVRGRIVVGALCALIVLVGGAAAETSASAQGVVISEFRTRGPLGGERRVHRAVQRDRRGRADRRLAGQGLEQRGNCEHAGDDPGGHDARGGMSLPPHERDADDGLQRFRRGRSDVYDGHHGRRRESRSRSRTPPLSTRSA